MTQMRFIDRRVHVVQGDHAVSVREPGTVLTTVLGSCVAACVRDPLTGIGGMNHFLLPGNSATQDDVRYGVHAMEILINAVLREGAARERLEVKLFGGARMLDGVNDIGGANARFATDFLANEGLRHAGGSLGGNSARRIQYWPYDGFARQTVVADALPAEVSVPEMLPAPEPADSGELELF